MGEGNEYFRLQHDPALRVLRVIRSALPFPSLAVMKSSQDELAPLIRVYTGQRLLLDFSGGPPGRNDDAFEDATKPIVQVLEKSFAKVAVLVRTRAGELQVRRMAKRDGRQPHVFSDEREALRWLTEP
jgi:hypothetical protein